MALKDHKCKLTIIKKWEEELNCKLEYDISGIDVVCSWCKSIKKDGLKSHLHTNQHKKAEWLEKQSKMGVEVYSQAVIETSTVGCPVSKLQGKDKASLEVKFNIAYY